MSACKYYDCGWCYAPDYLKTNAVQGGCFEPEHCPSQMTDLKFTSPSGETTIKVQDTGRLGTVAPKTQLHIKMDEPVQYETPMTENEEEIEKVKAQIKVLEKKLSFLEELEKQPKMTLANSGEFDVVSYNYKLYYRFEYPDSGNFSWYKTQDVPKGYVTGVFEPVTDAETERLLEGLYYNHIVMKKETAQERGERVHNEMEEAYKKWWGEYPSNTWQVDVNRWDAFQSGYNAAYEEKVSEWKPTPQTPEQVADGLKEAFREAVKQGVVSSSTKPQTLTDLIYDWWSDVFTTHSDWDMETSIANLVDEISLWLPTEHCTNSYKWNQCIRTIREKLR